MVHKVPDTGAPPVVGDAHTLQTLRLGGADALENTKIIEEGAAGGAEVFGAGFIAWEVRAIQEQDTVALPCQQDAHRRPGRSGANHYDFMSHLPLASRGTR
jgi:hypothetical protein